MYTKSPCVTASIQSKETDEQQQQLVCVRNTIQLAVMHLCSYHSAQELTPLLLCVETIRLRLLTARWSFIDSFCLFVCCSHMLLALCEDVTYYYIPQRASK
jgi:hypothetical protein